MTRRHACAVALFARADAVKPGARGALEAKALVLNGAPPAAANFARFVQSSDGRRILAAHGFTLPQ